MSSIRSVLIFLAFLLVLFIPGFSQQDPKETAREYMEVAEGMIAETKAIDDARGLMVTAADLDTTFIKANFEAGRLQLLTIGKDLAVKYLKRVMRQDPAYRFDIEYLIGRSYQYGENFDMAIYYYNLYKDKLSKKSNYQGKDKIDLAVVDRAIYECQNGKQFVSNPQNFSIVNIGREINSEFEDYAPVFNETEDEVVFTTRRRDDNLNQNVFDDNKPWEDIFFSTKKDGKWSFAKNIGEPVNTPYHDSNLSLSADGNTLFIFKDDGGGDIYFSERTNGVWSPPAPLPGIINSSFEEKSISMSADEKTLYFSSNRPGGYGGLDIYRATKDSKGAWSNVKNLGPKINTEVDDDGPFIDYDGTTLYFSSRGRRGMGGFDVFRATFDPASNEWSEPENLGYPINTPDDDVFFVASKDGKRAYYSSVREDGMGYLDIYMITIPDGLKNLASKTTPTPVKEPDPIKEPTPDPVTVARNDQTKEPTTVEPVTPPVNDPTKTDATKQPTKEPVKTEPVKTEPKVAPVKKETIPLKYEVTIVDSDSKTPVNAKVKLVGAKDNVIVPLTNNGNGVYTFSVKSQQPKDYRLSVDADGYIFVNQNVRIAGASTDEKTVGRTIELRKISIGATSILRNLYFDFDKATFQTESYTELNKLEAMMRSNPDMQIEIGGHADAVGTKAYNLFLSRKRAEAVKDYLTKKGVDARRIKATGYGKSRPLASNDDEEEGRELNRRVEFTVLK
ncbi:OmpA family protein [Fulvivirgaceae bacterium PWU37]|uniref:OmpA family protein n=2 Tax=Dawidia soli TaxID=2782352 RepID=A0AAP2GKB1_9BACT|nr:OmpA family protein [Dawidia soli]